MDKRNKVVYIHKRKKDGQIFYVGMGSIKRPYDMIGRSTMWKRYVKKHGKPDVQIIKGYLTKKEALALERKLIYKYGLKIEAKGNLVNAAWGESKFGKIKKHPSFFELERYFKYR